MQKLGVIKITRNKRSVVAVSFKFLQELPSKLEEVQCKKGMFFSFDFGWYFISLDILPVKNRLGGGVGLTARQNPLAKHDKS